MQQELLDLIYKNYQPIFKAYDKDGNSTLEKPELRLLLADNLGVTPEQITQDQLDWHFNQIDENGDGHITFNEYVFNIVNLVQPFVYEISQIKKRKYRKRR